jgi:hypothetical protein
VKGNTGRGHDLLYLHLDHLHVYRVQIFRLDCSIFTAKASEPGGLLNSDNVCETITVFLVYSIWSARSPSLRRRGWPCIVLGGGPMRQWPDAKVCFRQTFKHFGDYSKL